MKQTITIEAGKAFGSGAHPSTSLALSLLGKVLAETPHARVLDMGCGSGVLAVAAAKLGARSILAADISAEAVAQTLQNAKENAVADIIEVVRSDGFSHARIQSAKPFDIIICNMLAEPILRWAKAMSECLAPGGTLLLSGLLAWQIAPIETAFQELGLAHVIELQSDDWRALLFSKDDKEASLG